MSIVPSRPSSSSVRFHVPSGRSCPRPAVVGEQDLDDPGEPVARLEVLDRHDRLDPPVEVAVHEVGRPDVPLRIAAVGEAPDPRVLEELADDRSNADALGQARHAGLERTRAADDQLDPDPRPRRLVERLDAGHVHDRVELEDDARLVADARVLDLAGDELEEPRSEAVRATSSRRNECWRDRPVSTLNRSVTSAPISGRAVSRPRSTYRRAVFGL